MKLARVPQIVAIELLRAYKFAISPFFPPACRYIPTCSEYAIEAVDRHGVVRGSMLSFWRLLRCHPFVKGGFDPVPLKNVTPHAQACPERSRRITSERVLAHVHENAHH